MERTNGNIPTAADRPRRPHRQLLLGGGEQFDAGGVPGNGDGDGNLRRRFHHPQVPLQQQQQQRTVYHAPVTAAPANTMNRQANTNQHMYNDPVQQQQQQQQQQVAQMQQLAHHRHLSAQQQQLPPPMGHDDFFAHSDHRIGHPQITMQMPKRPSLSLALGEPGLSGCSATTSSTCMPSPHQQQEMTMMLNHPNTFNNMTMSPMMAHPNSTSYSASSRSDAAVRASSSSVASLHQRQQQELYELQEKERRLLELRQEQERLRRIKRERREAVRQAQEAARYSNQQRAGANTGSFSFTRTSDPSPVPTAAPNSTGTATPLSNAEGSNSGPPPRPPSICAAVPAPPAPPKSNNTGNVNVPPPAATATNGQQGWSICTLCQSRAFESDSDLAEHQNMCASNSASTAAIRASFTAQKQAQARAQAELRERLSSARAQVAALQQQIQQTQQMIPLSRSVATPTSINGGAVSSSMLSQPMVPMASSNSDSRINASKHHLDSIGIEDVTRLTMQEMTRKPAVDEIAADGKANDTTVRGLTPPETIEQQKQLPSSMSTLTSPAMTHPTHTTTAEDFDPDEVVLGELLESPVPLGIPLDKDMLTPLHCFIREHCVEIFTASKVEAEAPSKGKRRAIQPHQVGIRCPYCKGRPCSPDKSACTPPAEGTHGNSAGPERGSVYYPFTTASIYNGTMNLIQRHLQCCPVRPLWVIDRYNEIKRDEARSGSSKAYWVEAARRLGLYDTSEGIRYDPSLVDRTMSFHRPDGYHPAPQRIAKQSNKHVMPPLAASVGFYSNESAAANGVNVEPSHELAAAAMHEAASQMGNPPAKPYSHPQSSSTMTSTGIVQGPADEEGNLVEPADRTLSTSFSYYLMLQMRKCHFAEADRLGKRKGLPAGFAGLACRHCYGGFGSGRFFPSTLKTLSDSSKTLNVLHNHMSRCRKCPMEVRDSLTKLKLRHDVERARMKFGSQKNFFVQIWSRLHGAGRAIGSVGASMATCVPSVASQHQWERQHRQQQQQPMMPTSTMMPPPPVVRPPHPQQMQMQTQMQMQMQMQMQVPPPPQKSNQRPIGPPPDNSLAALAVLAGMKRKDRGDGEQESGASSQEEKRSRAI